MRFWKFWFSFFCAVALISCSKVIGYGVVNWSMPEYNLVAGDVLPVYVKSNVSKTYIVEISSKGEMQEIPLWQLTFFKSKNDVEEFRHKIAENAYMYAEVLSDGLPMRLEPENISKQVYRLRKGQIIKILWQGEGVPVLRNGEPLPGDWFRVMTDDGSMGWCFSLNLQIYDEREATAEAQESSIPQDDAVLKEILEKQWYPESYGKMVAINRVDLENISPDYGFFPGIKTKIARVNLQDLDLSFSYNKISKGQGSIYNFEGSTLSMQVREQNRISVQYTDEKGMPDVGYFVSLSKPLEKIIEEETTRRNQVIENIAKTATKFTSLSYGSLSISAEGNFIWTGYAVLSGKIIPKAAKTTGTVAVRFFPSPKFSSKYDSVLSFYFDGVADSIDFLASLSNNGLLLEYVDKKNIVNSIVENKNKQPTVLFFAK